MGFFDSDEKIEKLNALWAEGLSASQIAKAFEHPKCTRSTVIGKIHRLKLATRAVHLKTKDTRIIHSFRQPRKELPIAPKPAIPEPEEIGPLNDFPDTREACRHIKACPSTEPWRCCGQPVKPENPYCEYHCQVNFQKVIPYKLKTGKGSRRVSDGSYHRDFMAS